MNIDYEQIYFLAALGCLLFHFTLKVWIRKQHSKANILLVIIIVCSWALSLELAQLYSGEKSENGLHACWSAKYSASLFRLPSVYV